MEHLEQMVSGYIGSHIAINTNLLRAALNLPEDASSESATIASTQEEPPTGWNQNLPRRYPETKQEAQSPPKGYSFEEQMRWYPDPPPQDEEEEVASYEAGEYEKSGNQSVPLASDVAQDALDGSGAVLPPQQQEKCLLWGTMRQAVSWELAQENGAPGL